MNSAGVAHLDRSGLTAEKHGLREKLWFNVGGFENNGFALSGAIRVYAAGKEEERWSAYQDCNGKYEKKTTMHGVSLAGNARPCETACTRIASARWQGNLNLARCIANEKSQVDQPNVY